MRCKNKIQQLDVITKAIFVVIFFLTIWLFTYSVGNNYSEHEAYIGSFSSNELNGGWTLVKTDGTVIENVMLPWNTHMTKGETVLLRNSLPEDIRNGMRLSVRSQQQDIRVFINGTERGNYLSQNVTRGGGVAPSAFLLVDLYDEDALGMIELQITPGATELGRFHEVTYAYGNNVWFPYIMRNVTSVFVADLLIFMGLAAAIAYFVSRKRLHFAKSVLYLAETMIIAGMWMLSESEIRQMLFLSPSLSNIFSFLLIEIMPAFLLMYFNELQNQRYSKAYVFLETVSLILLLINVTLNVRRILSLYQTIRYFHALCGFMILFVLWTLAHDIRTKQIRHYRITAFGILLLMAALILELVNFYTARSAGGLGAFLGIGLVTLLGTTALQVTSNELSMMEEKRAAEAANHAKSAFLASMSHEIRTPISAILGMDELILRESGENETLARATEIQNTGRTLLSLINDILDFSKIEEGKMEILPVHYELGSMVNNLVNMIRDRAEEKGLHLNVQVQEGTPHMLCGDEVRIRQCVLNLLTNAVKYTQKGTVTLEIGFEPDEGEMIQLSFRVTDTGIGMKQEDMDKLFAPFTRIEELRNRSIEGTGLGLSITQRLLKLMDSKLDVQSVYGAGSTFSFAIRQEVVDRSPVGKLAGRHETDGLGRNVYLERFHAPDGRMLVIDDMPVNLNVICGLLKKTQLQIDAADSGMRALVLAAKKHYDVILIDHMMPGMDGIETLRELKQLPGSEHTAYIALTANALSGAREQYIEAGFADYLSKPVDSARLEETLMRYLPAGKVVMQQKDPGQEEELQFELPDGVYRIRELDVQTGLRYCGTAESYWETLVIYANNVAPLAEELALLRRAQDLAGLTVKVHALKSGSRAIGAESLGTLAERLETAGNVGDAETMENGLDELLYRYRALGKQLETLIRASEQEQPGADALPLISAEMLRTTYETLHELLESMDYERIAVVTDRLAAYRIPEEERDRCEKICFAANNFDWDKIEELLP